MELQIIEKATILGMELNVYGDSENPLFLARDIASRIDYDLSSINKMINNVDDSEKVRNNLPTLGGVQETWFLTEDGVYEVLMTSRKPIAKEFRKGFKEFLKAWRRGQVKVVEAPKVPQTYKEALLEIIKIEEEKERMALELKEAEPKLEYHDKVLKSNRLVTTSDIAKDLGMSAIALNRRLNEAKIIYKQSKNWKFYSEHEDKVPTYADYHITEFGQSLKWSEIGRRWIVELFENGEI